MANLGFIYEQQIYNSYKQVGRVPVGFSPAGSNQNAPDFIFSSFRNVQANIELKAEGETENRKLDYGQAGLIQLDNGQWSFSPRSTNKNLIGAYLKYGLLNKINQSKWGTVKSKYLISVAARRPTVEKNAAYKSDKQTFYGCENWIANGFRMDSSIVRSYYASKGVNYINVKHRGFYLIGNDVLGLNPPLFNPLDVSVVIRQKTSTSSQSIRFTTALRVNGYPSSNGLDLTNREKFLLAVRNVEFPDGIEGQQVQDQRNLAIGFQAQSRSK